MLWIINSLAASKLISTNEGSIERVEDSKVIGEADVVGKKFVMRFFTSGAQPALVELR